MPSIVATIQVRSKQAGSGFRSGRQPPSCLPIALHGEIIDGDQDKQVS